MSDWAGIKKAINSNLSLPLNEKIDRDIEENRIGHGFLTSSVAELSGTVGNVLEGKVFTQQTLYDPHIVLYRNSLYIVGTSISSTHSNDFYKVDKDTGEMVEVSSSPKLAIYGGTVFVYRDEIYAMGGTYSDYHKHFQKYDGTSWTQLTNLPFSYYAGYSYVYKDKVYVSEVNSNGNMYSIKVFDGSSWDEITISEPLCSFFEKNGKLYSMSSGLAFYFLDENTNTFIKDSDFPTPNISVSVSDLGEVKFYIGATGKLHLLYGKSAIVLEDKVNEWVIGGYAGGNNSDNIDGYGSRSPTAYAILGDYVYFSEYDSNSYFQRRPINQYKEISYFLPKNSIIFLENAEQYDILPVNNCEMIDAAHLRVIEDGDVTFRLRECYLSLDRVLIK